MSGFIGAAAALLALTLGLALGQMLRRLGFCLPQRVARTIEIGVMVATAAAMIAFLPLKSLVLTIGLAFVLVFNWSFFHSFGGGFYQR